MKLLITIFGNEPEEAFLTNVPGALFGLLNEFSLESPACILRVISDVEKVLWHSDAVEHAETMLSDLPETLSYARE